MNTLFFIIFWNLGNLYWKLTLTKNIRWMLSLLTSLTHACSVWPSTHGFRMGRRGGRFNLPIPSLPWHHHWRKVKRPPYALLLAKPAYFLRDQPKEFFFTLKWHHYYHHYWTVLGRFLFIVINVPNTWSVSSQSVGKTILLALEMSSYIYGQLRGVVSLANLGGLPHEVRGSRHLVLHASHFMNCWLFNIWRCWIHQSKSCKK